METNEEIQERLFEEFSLIFAEDSNKKWNGDNAYQGLQILSKYTDYLIQGAEHDIIYSEDLGKLIEMGLTKEDCIKLRDLNWMIDEECDCLACFV